MALTEKIPSHGGQTERTSHPRISSVKSDGSDLPFERLSTRLSNIPENFAQHDASDLPFERLSTRLSNIPENFAQHDASDYLSEIQDLMYKTYMHSGAPSFSNYSLNGGSVSRKSRQRSTCTRFSSSQGRLQNVVLDQSTFTENLIKRLSLTRRLSSTIPNTLPPAIETYFEINTILIRKSAALLPSMAFNVSDQLHPLLALNIRHLELHVKISLRPIYGSLRQTHRFEAKAEHISHCSIHLPSIVDQLPRLRTLVLVLDSLFDLPPRPSDYQRFLRTHHYHAGASREENIRDSDVEDQMGLVIVPGLRRLATRTKRLSRVAVRHHPGTSMREEPEVVNGVNCTDEAIAKAVLARHGREVVLKGWL